MNILVTGGAGFIGSHIVDALVERDDTTVTVVDDLSFGKKEQVSPKATFIEQSICDPSIDAVFADGSFDVVIHCAAQKSVRQSFEDPVYDAEQNIIGLLRLLEACKKYTVGAFILLSTGGTIYGEASTFPTPETADLEPLSPYTASKLAGEVYINYYSKIYGLTGISLRLANVYGPRQDPKGEAGVLAIFSDRILNNEPLLIYGDGNQTRDYIYVSDVVSACTAVLERLDEPIAGQYNIGTGEETSVNELAEKITSVSGASVHIEHIDAIPGELSRSAIDNSLFKQQFKWGVTVPLEQGIEKTFKWFSSQS